MELPANARRAEDLAIADQCRLNVLWLNGCACCQRVLEIEVADLSLGAALQSLYGRVERCGGLNTDEGSSPFAGASFDLVTLYGRTPERGELTAMRRLLRPGGAAVFAAQNRWWYGRRRTASRAASTMSLRDAGRILDAGFSDVRTYWVEPSLAIPRNLIPATADRVRDFEELQAQDSERSPNRSLALAAGIRWALYPAVLFVATV